MIGSATVEISTTNCEYLSGFNERRKWDSTNPVRLELNSIAVSRNNEETLVIVSVDAVFCNSLFRRVVQDYAKRNVKIVLVASHSHYTPSLMPEFPGLGIHSEVFLEDLAADLNSCVDQALKRLKENSEDLKLYKSNSSYKVSYRRKKGVVAQKKPPFVNYKTMMRPNFSHQSDEKVKIMRFVSGENNIFIWSFACHPTSFYNRNSLSSEYPGFIREKLRNEYGPNTVVIFFQGASGDIRMPFFSNSLKRIGFSNWLRGLFDFNNPIYVTPEESEWKRWAEGLYEKAFKNAESIEIDVDTQAKHSWRSYNISTATLFTGKHPIDNLTGAKLSLFGSINFFFISAEVTSSLMALILDRLSHHGEVYEVATCTDQCVGYLCTEKERLEGGYETKDWANGFGINVSIKPQCEETLLEAFTDRPSYN